MVGYGNRFGGETVRVNALMYRFNSDGTFDNTWGAPGSNGLIAVRPRRRRGPLP